MAAKSASNPALTKLIPIGIIVVVALVLLYMFVLGGSRKPVVAPTAPAPTAATPGAPAAAAPAPAPEALPELNEQQLQKEASTAMQEKRFVAPAGNNAFEYYERLLDKDPANQTAKDALRETFPMVIGVPEQEINAGNLDEATRIINLLAKADPNNYTLTILRSKLDAKKKQVEREQAQQAAQTAAAAAAAAKQQQAAAAAAAAPAPAPAAAAPPPAETAATTPPSSAAAGARNTAGNNAAGTNTAPAQAPAPAAPAGETRAAEIVKATPPDYPPEAARRREEGWVEVEFTVQPDGTVADASVVNSQPARVFNSSALHAVERWTFKPRLENGKPVAEKVRRRIEFKL